MWCCSTTGSDPSLQNSRLSAAVGQVYALRSIEVYARKRIDIVCYFIGGPTTGAGSTLEAGGVSLEISIYSTLDSIVSIYATLANLSMLLAVALMA